MYLSVCWISALKRLPKPLIELDIRKKYPVRVKQISQLVALPKGQALVTIPPPYSDQYFRISKEGRIETKHYCEKCDKNSWTGGLLILGVNLYIIHTDGTVFEILVNNNKLLHVYYIPNVSRVINRGSFYSDPSIITNKDVLLLADIGKHEVFTYNLSTNKKEIRVSGISYPTSVTYSFYMNMTYYIVCAHRERYINVYDSKWHLLRSFGPNGTRSYFMSAIVTPEETILVVYSNRVSEFTLKGQFLGDIITKYGAITFISFSYPHLWLVKTRTRELERYKLYDDETY